MWSGYRAGALAAGTALLALIAWQMPRGLAALDYFAVERVEVTGARYLAPHAVLDAASIGETASVFGDLQGWRDRLLAHPLIEEAAVSRRLPRTLVIEIRELEPVALAPVPELRPVDAAGRILPLEAAGHVLDLPVLLVPDGVWAAASERRAAPVGGGESRAALAPAAGPGPGSGTGAEAMKVEPDSSTGSGTGMLEVADPMIADPVIEVLAGLLARLLEADVDLSSRVSEVHAAAGGAARLLLREPDGAEVLLEAEAGAVDFAQLAATLSDLEVRGETRGSPRLDLRYREQVVVSFHSRTD